MTRAYASVISNCLDTITLSFSSETNTPIVEVQARIEAILSFDAPELNSAKKFGVWLDSATLVVVFAECAKLEGRLDKRAVSAVFEAERGENVSATIQSDQRLLNWYNYDEYSSYVHVPHK